MLTPRFLVRAALSAGIFIGAAWAEMRTFKNDKGVKLEAEIVSKNDTHVTIRNDKGKEFTIRIETFSQEDQDYINGWEDPEAKKALLAVNYDKLMDARGYAKLPFTEKEGRMYVDFTLKGEEVNFVIDTSSNFTFLNAKVAEGMKFEYEDANIRFSNGDVKVSGKAMTKQCVMGGVEDVKMELIVITFDHLQEELRGVSGIFGSDFLQKKDAIIDYGSRALWVKVKD